MGIAEVFVIVASVVLAGFLWWFFFGPKKASGAAVRGGVQEVDITVRGGYSPDFIRVTEGVPLRLNFDRQESGDCTSRVVFADFAASKTLPTFGTASLEFTPDKAGEFDFACGMNMIHGKLVVEPAGAAQSLASSVDQPSEDHAVAQAVGVGPSTDEPVKTDQVEFRVSGMSCASCVVNIERVLGQIAGVDRVEVSFGTERATVDFDPKQVTPAQLQAAVADAGYKLVPRDATGTVATRDVLHRLAHPPHWPADLAPPHSRHEQLDHDRHHRRLRLQPPLHQGSRRPRPSHNSGPAGSK